MNNWLNTTEEKLKSLIADEAKQVKMLESMNDTLRQLKAKSQFRLAIANQLLEEHLQEKN